MEAWSRNGRPSPAGNEFINSVRYTERSPSTQRPASLIGRSQPGRPECQMRRSDCTEGAQPSSLPRYVHLPIVGVQRVATTPGKREACWPTTKARARNQVPLVRTGLRPSSGRGSISGSGVLSRAASDQPQQMPPRVGRRLLAGTAVSHRRSPRDCPYPITRAPPSSAEGPHCFRLADIAQRRQDDAADDGNAARMASLNLPRGET